MLSEKAASWIRNILIRPMVTALSDRVDALEARLREVERQVDRDLDAIEHSTEFFFAKKCIGTEYCGCQDCMHKCACNRCRNYTTIRRSLCVSCEERKCPA